MARSASKVRLLRSLTRAAKSQQSLLVKLIDVYTPAPQKAARKVAPRKRPAKVVAAKPAASKAVLPAPGNLSTGHYPLPLKPGQAVVQGMRYLLYLPKHVPDSVARHGWPLVVMLHGCQQTASEFAQGTRMNQVAEEKGYAVLYPQQLASAQAQRCWRWYDRPAQQGGGETAVLADLIGTVCASHPIDRRRIYACGLSAGAGMAAMLALNHPELIAAIGLHSAPVFGVGHSPVSALHVMRHGALGQGDGAIVDVLQRRAGQVMPPMPALLIQGEDDQVVRPVNQQQLARQWLHLNGLPALMPPRVTLKPPGRGGSRNAHAIHDYVIGRKVLLRVIRVAGLGHAWSGGDPGLAFNAKAGPDASRMMVAFFGRWRR